MRYKAQAARCGWPTYHLSPSPSPSESATRCGRTFGDGGFSLLYFSNSREGFCNGRWMWSPRWVCLFLSWIPFHPHEELGLQKSGLSENFWWSIPDDASWQWQPLGGNVARQRFPNMGPRGYGKPCCRYIVMDAMPLSSIHPMGMGWGWSDSDLFESTRRIVARGRCTRSLLVDPVCAFVRHSSLRWSWSQIYSWEQRSDLTF